MSQVVAAGRSTANLTFGQRDEFEAGHQRQQITRLLANLLRVAEMTSVVIGRSEFDFTSWLDRAERHQELGHVLNLVSKLVEPLPRRIVGWRKLVSDVAVIFQHRATAGDVDDDGIDVVDVERGGVLLSELQGRFAGSAVIVDRSAADLIARHDNLTAVVLQHARGRPIRRPEHRVRYAAGEKCDSCAALADRRQHFRQLRRRRRQRRQQRLHPLKLLRQEFRDTESFGEAIQPESLRPASRRERPAQSIRVRKQAVKNELLKPAVGLRISRGQFALLHLDTKWFDQPAVLHARGTRRFAGSAVEAQFQVMLDGIGQLDATIHHAAHQIDASARTVVFVAGLEVRRARRRTQPAMHTTHEVAVVDIRPDGN